jgi:hypothetical protein
LAGGGGGTGSACSVLHETFERYLSSVGGSGKVFYIMTWPSAQESLNHTIVKNAFSLSNDIAEYPHIVLSNERQLGFLRGKVGIANMFPTANTAFAKLLHQILKLSSEQSSIQTFDSKDLERCLKTPKRTFIGATLIQNAKSPNLGSEIFQNCVKKSPCYEMKGNPKTGTLLLVISPEMAADPDIGSNLAAAVIICWRPNRNTFFWYLCKENIPGLIAVLSMSGLD